MNNKLCVITGANSGIGFETALELSRRGAYLVMVCRNEDKANTARREIMDETGNQGIDIVLCDFSIQSEIRQAARTIMDQYKQVDVLINNHGTILSEHNVTVDGIEETFAVNHLGYFLFTHLLLPALENADSGRIINVSSEAHRARSFDSNNIQLKKGFSPFKAYANSKLYNILFTKELAGRLLDTHLTVNCLHPGTVNTNFGNQGSLLMRLMILAGKPFMKNPESGAQTSIYLACSEEAEGVNGAYFKNKSAATPSKDARDAENAAELWNLSEKLCGI